jgi:phosphohistidine phosphatase SixA
MLKNVTKKGSFLLFGFIMVFIVVVMIGCAGITYQQPLTTQEVSQKRQMEMDAKNRQIIDDLRQGGYVIFLRHAKTDWTQKDIEPFDFTHCSGQRNLSEEGRAQAVKIGEAYRSLGIPVAEVISSPFCRCKDTAKLAFGLYELEENLQHVPYKEDREGRNKMKQLYDSLDEMLARVPPPGQNIVLVGHSPNLIRRVDIRHLPEGNTVVFRPDGKDSSELIGMIFPKDLFRLY